jgi:hypothetical protein
LPVFMKTGNRTPFLEREVVVLLGHCNTLPWCCTSFVSSGHPRFSLLRPAKSWMAGLRLA